MKPTLTLLAALLTPLAALHAADASSKTSTLPRTEVSFRTSDAELQRLYDAAESRAASNIVQFTPTMKAMVEGGGYQNVWIETQPMGGEMYAKRNLEVALNNQILFMLGQRADGRLPGMVTSGISARKSGQDKKPPEGMIWMPEQDLLADFEMFQGYYFPDPAWRSSQRGHGLTLDTPSSFEKSQRHASQREAGCEKSALARSIAPPSEQGKSCPPHRDCYQDVRSMNREPDDLRCSEP